MSGKLKRQHGATLIVVLILMLLVTLAGIAAVRSLVVEERMVANSLDRSLAMQSNEQQLRNTESMIPALAAASTPNAGFPITGGANPGVYSVAQSTTGASDPSPCQNGLCSQPTPGALARWDDPAFTGWMDASASSGSLSSASTQYIIEFLGADYSCNPQDSQALHNCSQYRVTVRTKPNAGGDGRAKVVLQTYYLTPPN